MEDELELQTTPTVATGSAAARAYAHVKQRLLDGRYAGGSLLSENEIARRLGISRTPVRQAFLQLEAEELLDLYPRRGALVRPISAAEIDDVLEARLLIEQHCARRVAARGAALAGALEGSLAEQERLLRDGGGDFTSSDRRFHRTIVAANGNAILTRQYDSLRDRQLRITAAAVAQDRDRLARFIADHRQIAAAIERGDGDAAAELMGAHLRGAYAQARRPPA
ncbi:MAG: GntR family transcriptional regulator [Solirubrobacteraceae bacterium]